MHLCQCYQNSGYKSTSVCTCISSHTSAIKHATYLAIAHYFLYMFTVDKCDVTVTYVYIGLKSNNMAHTSLHAPFSTLDIGRCSHNETCRTVGEGHARGQVPVLVRYTKCLHHACKHRREGSWLHRMHKVPFNITKA